MQIKNEVYIALVLLFTLSCRHTDPVDVALKLAGENRAELQKVLDRYKQDAADSLKYRAACFLIGQMVFHGFEEKQLLSADGERIPFDATAYLSMDLVTKALDSLRQVHVLDQQIRYDCRSLDAGYLINHIDSMTEVWEQTPWKEEMGFDMFCRYVLPYRAHSEPLSAWLQPMRERYGSGTTIPISSVEACALVNLKIRDHIRYNNRWVYGLGTRSVSELLNSSSGMCDDLTAYGICAMRSAGIPVAVDFVLWSHMNMGHSWGVVFDEKGKAHSFAPGEQQPGEHLDVFGKKKMAKVYRKHFDLQKESLASINQGKESLPPFFRSYTISDVTAEYVSVENVDYPLFEPVSDPYVYLCIFNMEWKPYAWGKEEEGRACFESMGMHAIYLPAAYRNGQVVPIGYPFLLGDDRKVYPLKVAERSHERIEVEITEYIEGVGHLTDGEDIPLYYWNNKEWSYLCSSVVKDKKVLFKDVPAGCLYKLQYPSRPFIVEDGMVSWY